MLKFFRSVVFLLVSVGFSHAQNLVIYRGSDTLTTYLEEIRVSCGKDTFRFKTFHFAKPVFQSDEIVDILIKGSHIQTYRNQFTQKQWLALDTITHLSSSRIAKQTTVIFFDKGKAVLDHRDRMDSLWLAEYFSGVKSPIKLAVYSASKVNPKQRKMINEASADYLKSIGLDPKNIAIVYENKPYVSGPEDFFPTGTVITDSFIQNQNTDFMRKQAEKYALVIQAQILREKMNPKN